MTLFSVQGLTATGQGSTNYDVTRDGRQFVMVVPVGTEAGNMTQEIHIVLNWTEELKRLVPTP